MRPHAFKLDSLGFKDGKHGEWHECPGCRQRVFFPDGWSDFQKRLTIATAWMGDVSVLDKEELARRTVHNDGPHGMDRGFHGVLAEDCEAAELFVAERIMIS